ncbi:MAG: chemotaxis protein CheX [Mycobacteriales bacterium]
MNDTLLELIPLSSDDLITITQDVWSSFLDLDLGSVPVESAALAGPVLTAVVSISGAWEGSLQLDCPQGHAVAAAATMFSAEIGTVTHEQACDALGELANVVTGNVKSLLPAPSALSIPSVRTTSPDPRPEAAGAPPALLRRVAFVAAPGPLHVSIWKAGTA